MKTKFKIFEKHAGSGHDLVKTVTTESEAIKEVEKIEAAWKGCATFTESYYLEVNDERPLNFAIFLDEGFPEVKEQLKDASLWLLLKDLVYQYEKLKYENQ